MADSIGIVAVPALIASGGSLSAAIALGSKTLVGIAMPAAWDAADITFQASADGGTTFGELVLTDLAAANAVAAVQIHSPAVGQVIGIDPNKLRGVNMIKVRSGTSGSAVTQNADRTLTLITKAVH
jgi:hypothetical protein